MAAALRVRFHIIRNARIENVGKSQSCMVSKLRIIWKQTVALNLPSSDGGDDMVLDGHATSSSRGSGQLGLVLLERVVKTSLSAMAMMTAPGAGLTATPGTF